MAKKKPRPGSVVRNKRATYDYALEESFIAGIVLTGPEIKSVRAGKASLGEAYCYVDPKDRPKIKGMHIAEFKNAGYVEQEPGRERELLLNKIEIKKIKSKIREKGYSLVPVELFISENGYAKLEIALGKGKKTVDKREDLKSKDIKKEISKYV
ncbi:SsrA-binding protein SmpB [bacterium]|nr:SsrA-binding protein SmpB [bacterium]